MASATFERSKIGTAHRRHTALGSINTEFDGSLNTEFETFHTTAKPLGMITTPIMFGSRVRSGSFPHRTRHLASPVDLSRRRLWL
jgi:hypothetical protein